MGIALLRGMLFLHCLGSLVNGVTVHVHTMHSHRLTATLAQDSLVANGVNTAKSAQRGTSAHSSNSATLIDKPVHTLIWEMIHSNLAAAEVCIGIFTFMLGLWIVALCINRGNDRREKEYGVASCDIDGASTARQALLPEPGVNIES